MQGRVKVAFVAAAMLIAGCSSWTQPASSPVPGTSTKPASVEAAASAPPAINGPIAFIRYVGGRPSIWQIDADGSNEEPMAIDLLSGIQPVWSCAAEDYAIAGWSPDGNWLAFAVGHGEVCDAHVGLVRADGSALTMLGDAGSFSWAPSSREIVLARQVDLGTSIRSELNFFDLEGRETRPPIGDETLEVTQAVYSPDGSRIAFAATKFPDGGEWLTHVLDLTSGDVVAVRDGIPIAWSPDGSRVLVTRWEEPPDEPWYTGLFLFDLADGTEVLVDKAELGAWSPDGSQIAYFQHGKVVIASSDLRQRIEISFDGTLSGKALSWAPDGKWLVLSLEGSADVIYICASDGSAIRKLAEGRAAAWRPRFN